jgi:hypothetical protein
MRKGRLTKVSMLQASMSANRHSRRMGVLDHYCPPQVFRFHSSPCVGLALSHLSCRSATRSPPPMYWFSLGSTVCVGRFVRLQRRGVEWAPVVYSRKLISSVRLAFRRTNLETLALKKSNGMNIFLGQTVCPSQSNDLLRSLTTVRVQYPAREFAYL